MRLILTAAAASLLLPTAAFAQAGPASTANATATAEVVAPLQIGCGPMHFGKLAPIHTATTVTVPAQGTPLGDPDNIVVPGTRNNAQPTGCNVTGEVGLAFHVTLPTSTTLTHGGDAMTLDTFTIGTDVDADPYNRVLEPVGGTGFNNFGVGATLHVGGDQPAGFTAARLSLACSTTEV